MANAGELTIRILDSKEVIEAMRAVGDKVKRLEKADATNGEIINRLHRKIIALEKAAGVITDDFGNYWRKDCHRCGEPMQIVRPGKATCSAECWDAE